jgi:hypothetical protein
MYGAPPIRRERDCSHVAKVRKRITLHSAQVLARPEGFFTNPFTADQLHSEKVLKNEKINVCRMTCATAQSNPPPCVGLEVDKFG